MLNLELQDYVDIIEEKGLKKKNINQTGLGFPVDIFHFFWRIGFFKFLKDYFFILTEFGQL